MEDDRGRQVTDGNDAVRASTIRAATLAIWLVIVCLTPYESYVSLPDGLLVPRGLFAAGWSEPIFRMVWTATALAVFKWSAIVLCTLALFVPRADRVTIPAAFLCILVLDTATKMLGGFVNHAQLAALFTLGILACYCDAKYLSIVSMVRKTGRSGVLVSPQHSAVIAFTGGVLVLAYAYIGLHRLLLAPSIFSGDALLWYLSGSSKGFSVYPTFVNLALFKPVLNAGFAVMTCLEVTSPLLLVSGRWRLRWLVVMTVFHFSIAVLMNILFWENLLLLWVTFWTPARQLRPDVTPVAEGVSPILAP